MGDQYECSIQDEKQFERFIEAAGKLESIAVTVGVSSPSPGDSKK